MATFTQESAKILRVYRRYVNAGGRNRYQRLQFDIISYDDNSGQYIVPVSYSTGQQTWAECNPPAADADFYITDTVPAVGVTQFD